MKREDNEAELRAFSENKKAQWEDQAKKHRAILTNKVCPLRSTTYKGAYDQDQYEDLGCLVERCAWWNDTFEKCGLVVDSYLKGIQVSREER